MRCKKLHRIGGTKVVYHKTMKYLRVFLGIFFFHVGVASAQDITAVDFGGQPIGKVIPDGTAINFQNEIIGQLSADGFVLNSKGQIVGGIVPQGFAVGNDYKYLGKVNTDGSVRLPSGKIAGRVLPSGLVVDDLHEIVGAVLSSGIVYDDLGKAVGRVAGNGQYVNLNGQNIGFVSPLGYAYRETETGFVLEGRLLSSKMVVNLEGQFIGSVAPGGIVSDFDGAMIGRIHANGFVYNSSNQILGRTVKTSYAFDNYGQYIGLVSYSGEVFNDGKVVAKLRADNQIVDLKGNVTGFALDLNSVALDQSGKYLGYLVPGGRIVKAQNEQVGFVGPRKKVFDSDGNIIGEIASTGPIFDYLGRLTAEAVPNGQVFSFEGSSLGFMKNNLAFDYTGSLIGAVLEPSLVLNDKQEILGLTGISSDFIQNSQKYKLSPLGYVYTLDQILTGQIVSLAPSFDENGQLFGYIGVNGNVIGLDSEAFKIDNSGLVISAQNDIKARQIKPAYAFLHDTKEKTNLAQNNIFYNQKRQPVAKIVPEYKIVPTDEKNKNLLMPVVGLAYPENGVILNVKGDMVGYANAQGQVVEAGGVAGKINDAGLAVSHKNAFLGEQVPFNAVVNGNCAPVGIVGTKGEVRNGRDNILGKILLNGQTVSEVGQYVGYQVKLGPVYDFNSQFLGTVNQSGFVLDENKQKVGCLTWNGRLYQENGTFQAALAEPVPAMSFSNQILGRINLKNQLINQEGVSAGHVLPDGTILDAKEKPVGLSFRYRFAFDRDNNFMGYVADDGQAFDDQNNFIGKVTHDGLLVLKGKPVGYALYDLYIYDDNNKTIGYLTNNSTVMSFAGTKLGKADRGFLVSKEGVLIGRGHRDYFVRDRQNNVIGELDLTGNVTAHDGQVIGSISGSGDVRDQTGKLLATAKPLQYYVVTSRKSEQWATMPEQSSSMLDDVRIEPIVVSGDSDVNLPSYTQKVIGVVLSPDGAYLGDLLETGDVIDPNTGEIIGRNDEGLVTDRDGNIIGTVEKETDETKRLRVGAIQKPSGQVPSTIFLPPDAYGTSSVPSNLGPGGGFGPGERYDPVRSRMLAAAQNARQQDVRVGKLSSTVNPSSITGWQDNWDNADYALSSWRVDMSEMILADKPIPAVLARTIMDSGGASDVPVTAIVERNVYAEDGRNIVIPAGSRVMGESSGGATGSSGGGAVRTEITWRRLIRPDGSAFEFSAAKTGDAQGRGGALGYLDERLLERYTAPIATSLMSSALAYVTASGQTTTSSDGNTVQDSKAQASNDARQNFLSQMDFIFNDLVQRKMEINSVTYVPAGTRLIIYPKVDLWLRTADREQLYEKKKLEKPEKLIDDEDPMGSIHEKSPNRSTASSSTSRSEVVYNGQDDRIEPSQPPLIDDGAYSRRTQRRAVAPGAVPPPPPSSSSSSSAGSSSSAASNPSAGQLF